MASPLQEYENNNRERWSVMHDIPPWIADFIINYLEMIFFRIKNDDAVQTIQCEMRMMLSDYCPVNYDNRHSFLSDLRDDRNSGSKKTLSLLDVAVKYIRDYAPRQIDMEDISRPLPKNEILGVVDSLLKKGSKWKVLQAVHSESGLIERVSPGITEIAQEIDNDFLTRAWNRAFQYQPDPEGAIESAQKAIEYLASKYGLTNATSNVYGVLLGDIKKNPDLYLSKAGDAYDLHNTIAKQPKEKVNINEQFSNWFWNGMDLIQKTNPARHSSSAVKDFSLSAEAAQQTVIIATMISWLIENRSFVRKKDHDPKQKIPN